uniref:C2H2-type domain-containing protein n=1 Tax=Phlebotomus papatasi TaxID=29031 RepID=A0A1B0D5A3_PHLPP
MDKIQPEIGENGNLLVQQSSKETFPDSMPLRGFSFNGFNMLDLSHHLENDTVMSTSSSTSGGLVIDHDDGDNNGDAAEAGRGGFVKTAGSNGRTDVFSTPKPRRRSSVWSGEKSMVVSNTRDYSQYLGMQQQQQQQPQQQMVKFKCYKCSESTFSTLRQLKEHQQMCLTKGQPEMTNGPNGRRTNGEHPREGKDDPSGKCRNSRKVFLCSACGTYYENWNLFLHMREIHRKHICLLCLGMFPSAERLHHHLEGRHGILATDTSTGDTLRNQLNSQMFYVMCVSCEHIFTEHDQFVHHNCDTYLQPCGLCNVRGSHAANCRASVSELKSKRNNGQNVQATAIQEKQPKPPQAPAEPPDPVGEMWKRYLNGDESKIPPTTDSPAEVTSSTVECEPRLLVPKLKVKIPKEYQAKIQSPESSSTEAESEEQEECEEINKSSEMSEGIAPQESATVEDEVKTEVTNQEEGNALQPEAMEDVKKEEDEQEPVKEEEMSQDVLEEKKESQSEDVPEANEEVKPEPKVEEDDEDDDGIPVASEDVQTFDLRLNQPLDRIDMVELLRICLRQTIPFCLYCNHATRIVVNAKYLAMHLIAMHRFAATVDSITAEELLPETIVARVKKSLEELDGIYVNLETFDSREGQEKALVKVCDRTFCCFQCRITAKIHKDLYQHNRKMHMKTVILCLMCKSALYSYSELLYHMCPGFTSTEAELKFRCGFCSLHSIPSAFRLMVHLRKKHGVCEICLEDCGDQFKLSNHVWKHKLQHLCFRCGIVYRNKPDITNHLFWKHGTESVTCKKCLQKKWPLVYHFCIPPAQFSCEHCSQIFTRAVSLTVHRRVHTGDFKYPCEEEGCDKKFISKKLLEKHVLKHSQFIPDEPIFIKAEEKMEVPEDKIPSPMDTQPVDGAEKSEKGERKAKKSKSSKKDGDLKKLELMDIDLPAPNLSESDSDMDIDREDSQDTSKKPQEQLPDAQSSLSVEPQSTAQSNSQLQIPMEVEEEDEEKAAPVEDIWENFKTYQTLQQQASRVEDGPEKDNPEEDAEASVPFLHVSQSDHDYCSIYRVSGKAKVPKEEPPAQEQHHKKEEEKPTDPEKSDNSSDTSSGSDSSCTCESNCSCSSSSSSGSSTSSSSSSDDDQQKQQHSPERRKKHIKKRDKAGKEVKEEEDEAKNNGDVIDVVTVEKGNGQEGDENFEVFYESDLVTEESDTDEDFYDEHPQKIAREMMMAWNRKFDGESRDDGGLAGDEAEEEPPTPAAPVKREKQQKVKRKKRDKKHQKLPPLKLTLQSVQV